MNNNNNNKPNNFFGCESMREGRDRGTSDCVV